MDAGIHKVLFQCDVRLRILVGRAFPPGDSYLAVVAVGQVTKRRREFLIG